MPRAAETPDVTLSRNSEKVHIPHISINTSQRCCRLPVTANNEHIIIQETNAEEKKLARRMYTYRYIVGTELQTIEPRVQRSQ